MEKLSKEWLKKQSLYMSWNELTDLYNKTFNTNKSVHYIKYWGQKLNLYRKSRSKGFRYTDEQREFILSQPAELSYEVIAELFNKKYNADLTRENIRYICRRAGIKHSFNPAQYTKENSPDNSSPVGSIRKKFNNKTGHFVFYIKYKDDDVKKDAFVENWMPLSRWKYIQAYGKIPENHQVIFLDGNSENCDITNLYAIPLSIKGAMAKNGFFSEFPEITKAGALVEVLRKNIK